MQTTKARPRLDMLFYLGIVLAGLITMTSGCGNTSVTDQPSVDGCKPAAIADTGGDQWLELGNTDVTQLGKYEASPEFKYKWDGPEGLSDYNVAQPYYVATKAGDFLFTLTVTSVKCNTNAQSYAMIHVISEPKRGTPATVQARDRLGRLQTYQTGYISDDHKEHYRAQYLHVGTGIYALKGLPEELDLTPPNFKVNRQPQGSCWAEGGRSTCEANVFYVFKKAVTISAQRIIDCSGFGSAASGGQISVDDCVDPKGVVYESDYPYNGHDNKCNKSAPFREKAQRAYIVKSATGGTAKWSDLKLAMFQFGSMEICGSAGALQNGGWVKNPGGGAVNHCYAAFGFLKGELHGQPAGEYLPIQNSWGDWGGGPGLHKGQGAYDIRASDGETIRSAVLTENKLPVFGVPCPPPIVDGGPDKTIRQIPGTPQFVQIGTPKLSGQSYKWDHESLLKDPKSYLNAQVYAAPLHTTKFRVTSQNSCAEAHAEVTVHVIEKLGGRVYEILETGPRLMEYAYAN